MMHDACQDQEGEAGPRCRRSVANSGPMASLERASLGRRWRSDFGARGAARANVKLRLTVVCGLAKLWRES